MPTPGKDESQDDFVSRCIPIVIDDGTAEDNEQAAAICFSMWRDAQKKEKEMTVERGLYLVEPHGRLIYEGKKTSIVKAREMALEGEWIIVSKDKAYGVAELESARLANALQFDEKFDEHRVTKNERQRWWEDKDLFYSHNIKEFTPYDKPREVVVQNGVKTFIEKVEFVVDAETVLDLAGDAEVVDLTEGKEDIESLEEKEEKAGRRVRKSKVTILKDLRKKAEDFLKSLGETIGWAEYEDKQPWLGPFRSYKEIEKLGGAAFTVKALDGSDWIVTWTMNSFKDREEEIFTQKSIEDYVERQADKDIKGQLQYWHLPGTKFGDIKAQAVIGRFLLEAGPFDDTEIGNAFKELFEENPSGHPEVAPEGWGASHGYYYVKEDREDGVYEWFDKEETTVLPASAASNPWNPTMEVVQMSQKQAKESLSKFFKPELVEKMLEVGDAETKEIEGLGIEHKELAEQITAIAEAVENKDVKSQLEKLADELAPAEEPKTDEPEEMDLKGIEEQLRSISEKIDNGEKLLALADAISGAGEKEKPAEEKAEGDEPRFVTYEEVEEALKAFGDVLTTIMDQQESIISSVESLVKDDVTKIKEKLDETPKESLKSLAESVIGNRGTLVRKNANLAKDGPEESEPNEEEYTGTGIPVLENIKARNIEQIRPGIRQGE